MTRTTFFQALAAAAILAASSGQAFAGESARAKGPETGRQETQLRWVSPGHGMPRIEYRTILSKGPYLMAKAEQPNARPNVRSGPR